MIIWILLAIVFVLAMFFTWMSGYQNASAIAASPFASHSLTKNEAVALIVISTLLGTLFSGSAVAGMIQSVSSWPEQSSLLPILAAALSAAIIWELFAQRIKLPASSTHALLGGIIGALFAGDWSFSHIRLGELDLLHPSGVLGGCLGLVLSPLLGFLCALILFTIILLLSLKATSKLNEFFKKAQWLSVSALAFGNGQNDTQKTMGLLVLALNAAGLVHTHDIPIWMRWLIGLTMSTASIYLSEGIVKKLAFHICKLQPAHAFAAESSSAAILIANSIIGAPVAVSQVASASIMGTGAAERFKAINWIVVQEILLSWFVTIPATSLLAVLIYAGIFQWFARNL